jgi:hypothetical protein
VQAASSGNSGIAAKPKALHPPSAAIPILQKAISQIETEDGWVLLGTVGDQISNLFSDFDSRTYGASKLSDLVRKTDAFEIEKGSGNSMRMRAKPVDSGSKTKAR